MQIDVSAKATEQKEQGEAKEKDNAVHKNGYEGLAGQVAQSTEAIIAALKAPRKMKTPDGRVYETA